MTRSAVRPEAWTSAQSAAWSSARAADCLPAASIPGDRPPAAEPSLPVEARPPAAARLEFGHDAMRLDAFLELRLLTFEKRLHLRNARLEALHDGDVLRDGFAPEAGFALV